LSAEAIDVDAHNGAFFEVDREGGAAEEEGGGGAQEGFVGGEEEAGFGFVDADFLPDFVRARVGDERVGFDGVTGAGQVFGSEGSALLGAFVGRSEDESRAGFGFEGDFEDLAEFLAAFGREFAIGVGDTDFGLIGNAMPQQVELQVLS
jgi:hypothetical protein